MYKRQAVISPLYILSRPLLFVFGPLGLISLSLFIVSFTAIGFSMSEGVTELVTETNDEIAAAKVFRAVSYTHLDVYKRQSLGRLGLSVLPK